MPDTIQVDIHTPDGDLLADSQIPDDYQIQEVIDELVDKLELPRFGADRAPIEYFLYSVRAGSYLAPTAIVSVALQNHDAVRLVAGSNGQPVTPTPGPTGALPPTRAENPDEIQVILKVLDLNRTEQVPLSSTRPVGDLIKQIVVNYNLPARDKLGQPNKYKLNSKALGDFLAETLTLNQAGVPPLDMLVLHRDETAGLGSQSH